MYNTNQIKMKSIIEQVVFLLLILGNISSLRASEMFPEGGMANGNFVPGTVLIYDQGQWKAIEEENSVDPSKYTFVIIHGAHSSIKSELISQLAKALVEKRPEANILAVDWSVWSSVGSKKIFGWSIAIGRKLLTKKNNDETTLTDIFTEIVKNAIPVEQAKQIPEVANRLTWKLFGEAGKTRTFTTLDPTSKKEIQSEMTALGLDPQKTHLIGHSHGAHVAGLTGMWVRKNELGQLDWISALDPSTNLVHEYPENRLGTGWDESAARLVAVFRTTYFFSSERKATNDSLFFDLCDLNHPIAKLKTVFKTKSVPKIYKCLNEIWNAELNNHSEVIRKFTEIIRKTGYLDEVFESSIPEEKENDELSPH